MAEWSALQTGSREDSCSTPVKTDSFFLEFIVVLNEILMLNEIQLFEMKLQFFWGVPMIIIIIIYLSS